MRTTSVRTVVVGLLVAGLLAFGVPPAAEAHDEPLIQPGAAVQLSGSVGGPYNGCTLNFVFRDARHAYIGTVARCAQQLGERAAMAGREFGTVVFRALSIPDLQESVTKTTSSDDFALIRVDSSETHRVSPVVLDFGRSPHGVTTSDETAAGDLLFVTGRGLGMDRSPTRLRPGVLVSDDPRGFHIAYPGSPGDGGAPVLHNLDAYGVISSTTNVNGPYGTTIERILHLLDEGGFRVELVTAYDENVRSEAARSGAEAETETPVDDDPDEAGLEVVRQLTRQYHEVTAAEADGFVQTDPCIPAMGLHYVNTDRWDERLEPGRPEIILYAPTLDGGRRLVGAEWVVTDDDQNLATDHDRPRLFGHDFQGPMPGHAPGQPIHYDLHAYAWVSNPLGGFEQFNPRVQCVGVVDSPLAAHAHRSHG